MRGRNNYAEIRIDYFQNATSAFEAFKVGDIDIRTEGDPNRWQNGYDFPAATDGRVVKVELDTGLPAGMSSLVFNTRRKPLSDIRVRKALTLLFDAEWINRQLYRGLYSRDAEFLRAVGAVVQRQCRQAHWNSPCSATTPAKSTRRYSPAASVSHSRMAAALTARISGRRLPC